MYPRDLKRLKIHIIPLKGVPKNGGHTEEIVEGVKHGVRKVNIDTDLRLAATGAILRYMAQNPAEFDPRKYLAETTKAMRDIAIARYEAFGAAGQAGKIKPLSLEAMFQRYESGELYKQLLLVAVTNKKAVQ